MKNSYFKLRIPYLVEMFRKNNFNNKERNNAVIFIKIVNSY